MPKALVPVGSGSAARPLVAHALDQAVATAGLTRVVVVAPPGDGVEQIRAALAPHLPPPPPPDEFDHGFLRTGTTTHGRNRRSAGISVDVIAGGAQRSDSVAAGLAALPDDVGIVLVHDAARAFTPTAVFDRVVDAVRGGHAAVIPAVPVVDTVKQVRSDPSGAVETVVATPDRAGLRAVQTPQGFLRETLARAHAASTPAATDDAGMVEALGGRVTVVAGDTRALKVTTPLDLEVAGLLAVEVGQAGGAGTPGGLVDEAVGDDRGTGTAGGLIDEALDDDYGAGTAGAAAPVLVVLSGLPGVGKTTVARALARRLGAAHLRVDRVEQGLLRGGLAPDQLGAQGYGATYAVAADQLAVGLDVVADLVNGIPETRAAWADVARDADARLVRVLLECSDEREHRERVEGRTADLPQHRLPTWAEVQERALPPWPDAEVRLDTAGADVEDLVDRIVQVCR